MRGGVQGKSRPEDISMMKEKRSAWRMIAGSKHVPAAGILVNM